MGRWRSTTSICGIATDLRVRHRRAVNLARFAWLSIAAAIVTIALKAVAYALTGSVGLLSDALEGLVNLAAAVLALGMLTIAARPPDDDHEHGHGKAEYFSSGAEGALIMVAAAGIVWTAIDRLIHPRALDALGLGLAISMLASVINLVVGQILIRAGKTHDSVTLNADGQHLMTDVWTSVGVLVGLGLVTLTGWEWLDPVVAFVVAANIVWTGGHLLRDAAAGLLDAVLPQNERDALAAILERRSSPTLQFHAVRTRRAAARRFVSLHVLVPGSISVTEGHRISEAIEQEIRDAIPGCNVATHIEPIARDFPACLGSRGR